MTTVQRLRRALALVATTAVLGVGATTAASASSGSNGGSHHLTAYFTRTIGLYKGNDVRILGVTVGHIDDLKVVGSKVKVTMTVKGKYKLPADLGAVVVPPSVVSDRFVQLSPAYTGGPTYDDATPLDTDRTRVPLEFDEIFKNLDQLNNALGPKGANSNGALSRLVDVSAANLKGNGTLLNGALSEFSKAISTLAGSRTDLFQTVANLQQFTTTLAQNDAGERALDANLQKVGTQLSGERQELGAALANLATALSLVNQFVSENKTRLTSDVTKLADVTKVLVREKEALQELTDMAPVALANLALAYDPKAHTLDTKDDAQVPAQTPTAPNGALCQLLSTFGLPCSAPSAPTSFGKGKTLAQLLAVK